MNLTLTAQNFRQLLLNKVAEFLQTLLLKLKLPLESTHKIKSGVAKGN